MARLIPTENTEILNIRISKSLKDKLNKLARRNGGTASSEIRYLIEVATKKL
jgi:predicted DNA-binding protein